MREPKTDAVFVEDILVATGKAQEFISGMTFEEFEADEKTVWAVIRAFEVIGEAAKRISPSIKERYSDLPWKLMAGMRDKLIHDYFGIDVEVLWKAVNQNLPRIEPQLRLLLSEIQS
jgi:uncharacterized protein with HEPN domain